MEETGGAQYRTDAANKLHEKKLNQVFLRKSNEHTNDQEFLVGVKKGAHSRVKSGHVIIV